MEMMLIEPRTLHFGGFTVNRYLPLRGINGVGPWVFFDHLGPHDFEPGGGIDVIPHPHINLGTVTYLFEGEIEHRDTLGSVQTIRPGEVNLMIAGKGIAHSERTSSGLRKKGHSLHGIQLWHALPENQEETDPLFFHYSGKSIPETSDRGVKIRVIIGNRAGLDSPVKTFGDAFLCELQMQSGSQYEPESADETALCLISGRIETGGSEYGPGAFLRYSAIPGVIKASEDSMLILIGGASPGKRYLWWNFVSSRKNRIEQAKKEWETMAFGYIESDKNERAGLPKEDTYSMMD